VPHNGGYFTLIESEIIITLLNIVYNLAHKIKIYFSSFWLISIIACTQEQLFLGIYFLSIIKIKFRIPINGMYTLLTTNV